MTEKPLTDTQFVAVRTANHRNRGRIVKFVLIDTSTGEKHEKTIAADLLARDLTAKRWQADYLAALWNNLAWEFWRKFTDSKL